MKKSPSAPVNTSPENLFNYGDFIDSLLPTEQELEHYFDRLWPICRSITGDGFRESLSIISEIFPYQPVEVRTGTKVLDWTVPKEWNISDAWVEDASGHRVIDFKKSNIHVLGYSTPVDMKLSLTDLQSHLHSLPDYPDAIPYVTSYYKERWGFCVSERQRQALKPGMYRAVIQSSLKAGSLTYGHSVIPGREKKEVLLSTYLCHPSLANNELSGPLVASFLGKALLRISQKRFTYRLLVAPETIGSITYLSKYGQHLKRMLHAGYVITSCGDPREINYKKSRRGNALVDLLTLHELGQYKKPFHTIEFSPWGSDERQYCSPGYDFPVGSIMRSNLSGYPEYHTSLDDKSVITFAALRETIKLYLRMLLCMEENRTYKTTIPYGEPMLSPRGLYPSLSVLQKQPPQFLDWLMWLLNQADGSQSLYDIAVKAKCSILELAPIAHLLKNRGLLNEVSVKLSRI